MASCAVAALAGGRPRAVRFLAVALVTWTKLFSVTLRNPYLTDPGAWYSLYVT
jgi:hypothetical protein